MERPHCFVTRMIPSYFKFWHFCTRICVGMDIELLQRKFSIEMISNKDLSNMCCLCNSKFISEVLEEVALSAIEHDDYYAMFLKHNNKTVAECVFHLTSPTTAKIELLCSQKNSVGAATLLMRSLLEKLKTFGCKTVSLHVAKDDINSHAKKFYEKLGFVNEYSNLYSINLTTYSGECRLKKKRERASSTPSSSRNNKRQEVERISISS